MLNGKCTICSASEPCSAIRSTQRPVFRRYLPICGRYSTHRCLKLEIWRFSWRQQQRQTDKTDCFTPCACARGNKEKGRVSYSLYPCVTVHDLLPYYLIQPETFHTYTTSSKRSWTITTAVTQGYDTLPPSLLYTLDGKKCSKSIFNAIWQYFCSSLIITQIILGSALLA